MTPQPQANQASTVLRGIPALPALTVAMLAWLALFPITSVDTYYHLATGRQILENRAIPVRGVGSATFGQAAWHDNEWGFQVLAASLVRAEQDEFRVWLLTGPSRVRLVLLRALCLALTLFLLSAHMASAGVDALSRSVGLTLAAFLTFGNLFWALRPQILSYLLLALTAYLLQRDRDGSRWAAGATLGVFAVWSNVHGAFVIGIVLLAIEAVGEWIDAYRGRDSLDHRSRARRLTILTVVAPAAACLNPHGYHQLLHPFLYLAEPEIYRGNVEWSRPDLLHLPLLLLTAALLTAALAARRRAPSADVLRCLAFGVLAASAIRHLPMAAIVWVPVLMASLFAAASEGGWRAKLLPTGPRWGPPVARLLAGAVLTVGIVALSGAKFVTLRPDFSESPVRPMPEKAVRIIARQDPDATVFNAYRFGGFLMFRLYPREVAFMDGRNDLYRSFRDDVYNPILTTVPGWRTLWSRAVREHDVRWVLVDEDKKGLVDSLGADPDWSAPPQAGISGVTDGSPGRDGIVLLRRTNPPGTTTP